MYQIQIRNHSGLNYLILSNSDDTSTACICLDQGARLDSLTLDQANLIEAIDPPTYSENYASSILFPFANRIKNGEYQFKETPYVLECNEPNKKNALHGLVYNQKFKCIEEKSTADYAEVSLYYETESNPEGFPFKYGLKAIYTLSQKELSLKVVVLNKHESSFPFTIGWHPYFSMSNRQSSSLIFDCKDQYLFDEHLIPSATKVLNKKMRLEVKDKFLDNAYSLQGSSVLFNTEEWQLKMQSSAQQNFLQLFTPKKNLNTIAIEPMTGISDSFNNKVGLQELSPGAEYNVTWKLTLKKH